MTSSTSSAPMPTFSADDDHLHAPGQKHSWTETSWWSFHIADRALAGWLYVQVRPHQRTTAGGAFVYDAQSSLPWQLPYYAMFDHQRLPADLDLTHARLESGVSIDCVDPGMIYDLAYRFRDQTDFVASLRFEGLIPPFPYLSGTPPFSASSHFDQPGRLTGMIELHGETIEVDCLSLRDRSWGPRPEHWGRGGRMSYAFATMDPRNGLLAFSHPSGEDPFTERESITTGYLLQDGVAARLVGGFRQSVRDPRTRMVRSIDLEVHDDLGRTARAHGQARSAMVLARHRVTFNTLLEWTDGQGRSGWGEDQDLWPVALLSDSLRTSH